MDFTTGVGSDFDADRNTRCYADRNAYRADTDAYGHANCDADGHAYGDSDFDAYGHADTDSYPTSPRTAMCRRRQPTRPFEGHSE